MKHLFDKDRLPTGGWSTARPMGQTGHGSDTLGLRVAIRSSTRFSIKSFHSVSIALDTAPPRWSGLLASRRHRRLLSANTLALGRDGWDDVRVASFFSRSLRKDFHVGERARAEQEAKGGALDLRYLAEWQRSMLRARLPVGRPQALGATRQCGTSLVPRPTAPPRTCGIPCRGI
jgi:hypothetical protein